MSRSYFERSVGTPFGHLPLLEWDAFVRSYWDRRPVLIQRLSRKPFVLGEVLRAARNAGRIPRSETAYAQFTVDRAQHADPTPGLPRSGERRFDAYQARMLDQTAGHRYALIVNRLHSLDFALWAREREFFAALWRRTGLPFSSAITTLFHGNYEHSPIGVHKDRFSTFMFVLKGRKRMRFWPRRPWREDVSSVLDYHAYMASSFAVEVGEGQALYWPASYYHVGESVDLRPATSVNVGIPRSEHRLRYDLDDLLPARGDMREVSSSRNDVAFVEAGLDQLRTQHNGMPLTWRAAAQRMRMRCQPHVLDARLREIALMRYGAAGFEPPPKPARRRALADHAWLRRMPESVLHWSRPRNGRVLYGANGYVADTDLPAATVAALIRRLNEGEPCSVAELLAWPAGGGAPGLVEERAARRRWLETLIAWRALCADAQVSS
ncbi:MAG: cupin [Lysobacteraceae bacterium]|nr:MAG: cupin [Xanthomonadaceae bacterium]